MLNRSIVAAACVGMVAFMTGSAYATEEHNGCEARESEPEAVSIQMDVGHSGVTWSENALKFPLSEVWRVEFNGTVSYPVIAHNRVFVTVGNESGFGSTLFALDTKTGKTLWTQTIEGTYYWSAATYDCGQIFVLNFDGLLKAFDEKTGIMDWSVQVANEYSVTSPPVAKNGLVYVEGSGSSALSAFDSSNGALIWTQSIAPGDGAPALGSDGIFTYSPCQVFAFNPVSGAPLWRYSGGCDGAGGGTTVYANGDLYVSDPYGSGNQILNSQTGAVIGTFEKDAGPPIVDKTDAYFLRYGKVKALSLQPKKVLWIFAGDGGISQSPIKVNNTIFVGSSSGLLWGLDAETGKQVWSTNVGAAILPIGCCSGPDTGLAEGNGFLIVPAQSFLVAYH